MSQIGTSVPFPASRITAIGAVTAFGDTTATHAALMQGKRALRMIPVLGRRGGQDVPLALGNRPLDESAPPSWLAPLRALHSEIPEAPWGSSRFPVFVTSSNFGVGNLYAFRTENDSRHLQFGTPHRSVEWLAGKLGWGPQVTVLSHACVSAHLGLMLAARTLDAGLAERALVFSFDYVSPFVAGGFHALKILNDAFPAPYSDRPTGSIGLGDGAAFAVLERPNSTGGFLLEDQRVFNEMHHFTANRADGSGFAACLHPFRSTVAGRRVWLKGHGTGTLEAGRLECAALTEAFPNSPLVGWKGSLGHTLGSCGLVELAVAIESIKTGCAPGTVGGGGPGFAPCIAWEPFDIASHDAVLCASNAFGGAHAALLLSHD